MVDRSLSQKKCVPCTSDQPPLKGKDLEGYKNRLDEKWQLENEHHIIKKYKFRNFREGLQFVDDVGALAEKEGHHPELSLKWGEVGVTLWTHKIGGLSESDFIFASKADALYDARHLG